MCRSLDWELTVVVQSFFLYNNKLCLDIPPVRIFFILSLLPISAYLLPSHFSPNPLSSQLLLSFSLFPWLRSISRHLNCPPIFLCLSFHLSPLSPFLPSLSLSPLSLPFSPISPFLPLSLSLSFSPPFSLLQMNMLV